MPSGPLWILRDNIFLIQMCFLVHLPNDMTGGSIQAQKEKEDSATGTGYRASCSPTWPHDPADPMMLDVAEADKDAVGSRGQAPYVNAIAWKQQQFILTRMHIYSGYRFALRAQNTTAKTKNSQIYRTLLNLISLKLLIIHIYFLNTVTFTALARNFCNIFSKAIIIGIFIPDLLKNASHI